MFFTPFSVELDRYFLVDHKTYTVVEVGPSIAVEPDCRFGQRLADHLHRMLEPSKLTCQVTSCIANRAALASYLAEASYRVLMAVGLVS